ncbi:MAG: Asp-tRNA(Asn)/Glu-tRNA(Gln) amidotransferase GatCAB subunit A [Gemmatimonadetes bacterium]|nr:Asp-tRNA(Asn)/Glu-tRNA(Gln) amidotransferase GatCAB subunit A [Gemmatimonadota bacterium]
MRETAREMARAVRLGERSARSCVELSLETIARLDRTISAFVHVDEAGALRAAEEIDSRRDSGRAVPPLAGVPIAVKDNICIEGLPTSCGSRILDGHISRYTATAVRRAREAGCIIIGKTNLDEFGMGSSTEHSCHGPTRNPWDRERTSGGSSGGSAAAVAAGMVPIALGSDTGGSIRQPAAFCGVVGFKSTYGMVSRFGLVAFGSSLDQIGPIATNVDDVEMLFEAISGPDQKDATCLEGEARGGRHDPGMEDGGPRIGVPREFFQAGLDPVIENLILTVLGELARDGAEIIELDIPLLDASIPVYYLISAAEASSNLSRFDGVRFGARIEGEPSADAMIRATRTAGFGDEVKRRIMLGTFALSAGYHDAFYGQASGMRHRMGEELARAFAAVDVLVGPTTPTLPFELGERLQDPLAMYLSDTYTVAANLAGLPAISIPAGHARGLPIGLQIMGPRLGDDLVFDVARAAAATPSCRDAAERLSSWPDGSADQGAAE